MHGEFAELYREQDVWASALVEVKYAGYIQRQERALERFRRLEHELIPSELNYRDISHLRREAVERWMAVRPRSVGQAARVSGIHPTDITVLLVELSRCERSSRTVLGRYRPKKRLAKSAYSTYIPIR